MPDAIYVKYKGEGEFISGVPAIDMTKERWERIPEGKRELALRDGLFELVEKKSKAKKEEEKVSKEAKE